MGDCRRPGCGHMQLKHSGPGNACNAMDTPGSRCGCTRFLDFDLAALMAAGRGDCFNVAGDSEQLCVFARLAAREYGRSRTEEKLHRWRELLAELLLNELVDERERIELLFEYCRDVGPEVDLFKGPPEGWMDRF